MSNDTTPAKQTVGIDVSADQLQVQIGQQSVGRQLSYSATKSFANGRTGFKKLYNWALETTGGPEKLWFVMEATGTYYEGLAYFLAERTDHVCVLVPHRAKHYAKSLPIKSKTDAIDARILARYGLERRPRHWEPTSPRLRKIKLLLREREQLQKQQTQLSNRRHAARQAFRHPETSIQRFRKHLQVIAQQLESIQDELNRLWSAADDRLTKATARIAEIGGLGRQTIRQILAETNGFALIRNRNQLASYSGLDVVLDDSGNRSGATSISKQGNSHIRGALYMPALSAIQHNEALKAFYHRLVAKHPDNKKIAITAVMRKLLLLIYSLWKSGQQYDPQFHYRQITKSA